MSAQSADVIVIGAGHNGLVCAGYLAQAGHDVLILERSHRIGGAAVTEEHVPGCHFSTFAYGAHGPGPKICRELEVPADAFTIVEPNCGMFFPFPDGDHILLRNDPQETAAHLARFGPREADGYLAYIEFLKLAQEITKEFFYTLPPTHHQLYERYRMTPHRSVLEAMLTRSHWDVLGDFFDTEKVKCAFSRSDDVGYPTAVGSLLAEAVESAADGAGVDGKSGVPVGGMGAVTAALAAAARRLGAEIRTESPVESILVESGCARGVRLMGGETLRAKIIVSNADPKHTFLTLVPSDALNSSFRRQVENLRTRAGNMKFLAVLNGVPRFTAMPSDLKDDPRYAASARIGPTLDYFEQAWCDALNGIPSRHPVFSTQLPTAFVPELAPPGKHLFGAWIRYGPRTLREGTWEGWRARVIETLLDTLEDYAPGFQDLIEWQRLLTPADIERETGITGASIRHIDMTLDQMLHRRPLPAWAAYKAPLDGLWLCGSGTHPCGSVTGAPGHNAAQAILEDNAR